LALSKRLKELGGKQERLDMGSAWFEEDTYGMTQREHTLKQYAIPRLMAHTVTEHP